MSAARVAIVVLGRSEPGWISALPPGTAQTHLLAPHRLQSVEDGLNEALRHTQADFFLAVAEGDRIRPAGLISLLQTLDGARADAAGAAAPTDQVRRDGSLRRLPATAPACHHGLQSLSRISTPVLFRTSALRAAGGWRPGEADWAHRSRRHRALLARLLVDGHLVAGRALLGTIARAEPTGAGLNRPTVAGTTAPASADSLPQVLAALLYRPVAVTVAGAPVVRGRLAAVQFNLATVATGNGALVLIPVSEIQAVQAL